MKLIRGRQKGFTLVEILVAIPIIALVGLAGGAVLVQLMHSGKITDGVSANRQVQIAGDRVSGDGLQFQEVTSGIASDNSSSGFPFTLKWVYWDSTDNTSKTHEVTYSLIEMPSGGSLKQLQRREVLKKGDGTTISDTTTICGRHINSSATNCRWLWETTPSPGHYSKTTFVFTVTAVVGDKTEARTYQVMGRAATG